MATLQVGPGIAAGGSRKNNYRNSEDFPDPFMDVASLHMPESMSDALRWCEFIFMKNGTYREAARRVVSYFLTDLEFGGDDREEKKKYKEFFYDQLGIQTLLHTVAMDYMCFHGDTKTTTRDGVFTLRELAGKTVDVLSKGGIYRPATFKSFGRQELLEVEFSDGRTVLATPEHQWIALNCSGKEVVVPTTALRKGYRIPRVTAPRPAQDEDFREGVRHGFVFGDGTKSGNRSIAYFCGAKDEAILPYFEGHGKSPKTVRPGVVRIGGLPGHYKTLPVNTSTASYWYGFVCGFLAADGSVDTYGCALLTQKAKATLERIVEQLPRIGMVAGPVRGHYRTAQFIRGDGTVFDYAGDMHYVTLLKQFMQPQDFLIPRHRENFERHFRSTKYGEYVGVKGVRRTGIVDEVFCCVEMETHTFVIENAVLTRQCYGNSFSSVIIPIRRYISCPKCGFESPLNKVYDNPQFKFKWSNFKFHAKCPGCQRVGEWRHNDRRNNSESDIRVKRWSPHEIDLLWDPTTDDVDYIWKIPADYRKTLREGHLFHLERANWEIVEAVKSDQNLRFDDQVIYHMKEEALAGLRNRGWGISRVLANFGQAWYVQVLHRYNEAIALDYVVPFRVITPMPRSGAGDGTGDPAVNQNLGGFAGRVNQMIKKHRQNPAGWNVLPFPIEYKALGGDATQFAPKDMLDQGVDRLLNDIGIPVDLYKGSLSMQTALPALRLFEANWSHLVHNLNKFCQHLADQVARLMNWDPIDVHLTRVTHSDALETQMAKLQLMMGQQISQTSGLKPLGLEFEEEQRRLIEEEKFVAEEQAKAQEDMEQSALMDELAPPGGAAAGALGGQPPGGMPPGGMPPGGDPMAPPAGATGGQPPMSMAGTPMGGAAAQMSAAQPMSSGIKPSTPEEMMADAQTTAQNLMAMPDSQRKSELINLKKSDPVKHSLVTSIIEDMRQEAQSVGGQQVLQQQYGGGGGAPPMAA